MKSATDPEGQAPRPYAMTARADAVANTRERIAREAMQLFIAGDYDDVTLAQIAAAAGVSHQTVLNHFENKEGVVRAVAEILGAETVDRRHQAEPGDVRGAVAALVGEYERFGDANARWAATADRLHTLAPLLDEGRQSHRDWLVEMFGASLPTAPKVRERTVHQLHVATDVYSWKLLRRDLGLDRAETERTMGEMVDAILARPIPSTERGAKPRRSR